MGELPGVLEGANTANFAQLIARPYFSPRRTDGWEATPLPTPGGTHDTAAQNALKEVTEAIRHSTPWAKQLTDNPTAATHYQKIQHADTALSVLAVTKSYYQWLDTHQNQ